MSASGGFNKHALKGLYVITDSHLIPHGAFLARVDEALAAGARIVQFRDKGTPDSAMLEKAVSLCRLCEKHGALFIVNDHVDIAVKCGAHGLHIGEDDSDIVQARKSMKSGVIGVSCYNDMERALRMQRKGADYVAFGSFFPSPVKPNARKAQVELLKQASGLLNIPICAIGGITADRAGLLVRNGADMIAVISDIWTAPLIKERVAEYVSLFH